MRGPIEMENGGQKWMPYRGNRAKRLTFNEQMEMRRPILLVLLSLWLISRLPGQAPMPLSLKFSRQNDFTWLSNFDLRQVWKHKKWEFDVLAHHDQIYNTSLSENRFVQQYVAGNIWLRRSLNPHWDGVVWLETDQYLSTQNEKISVYGGLRARPWPELTITPLIGYTLDRRAGTLNHGFTPALWLRAEKELEPGLRYFSNAFLRYKFIAPRRQYNASWFQSVTKQFDEQAMVAATLNATTNELDDFQNDMVKRIVSDTLAPGLQLVYRFTPKLVWQSNNRLMLSRRRFLFDELHEGSLSENNLSFVGLETTLSQQLTAQLGAWRLSGSYEFLYHSRRYELENNLDLSTIEFRNQLEREREKDFLKKDHKVDAMAEVALSRKHSLLVRAGSEYVQYDTPSEQNFDDRDELTYVGGLSWSAAWRRSFFTRFALSGNYRHYAFLFAEKSQDNYIQRGLRAEFQARWHLHRTLLAEVAQAVYVTYNVKDFREFGNTDRSTRNLETNVNLNWQPAKRFTATWQLNRKETHQSFLNWEAFSETTLDTTDYLTTELKCSWSPRARTEGREGYLRWGYKHFAQVRKMPAMMAGNDLMLHPVSLKQIVLRTGPLAGLGLRRANGSLLEAQVWMQVQVKKYKRELRGEPRGFSQTFTEDELNTVTQSLEPYPTFSVTWQF